MGMMFGAGLDLSNSTTLALGIVMAFVFGFLLTMLPLLRAAVPMAQALKLAIASDTLSISLMEIVDNKVMFFMSWSHGRRSWGLVILARFFFISHSRFGDFSFGALADIQRAGPRRCA
jgi:hypothetical protein